MKTLTLLTAFCLAGTLAAQQSGQTQSRTDSSRTGQSGQTQSRVDRSARDQNRTDTRTTDRSTANVQSTGKTNAEQVISSWKEKPREVAQKMIQKYGPPHEVSAQRLIWHRNGPWKFTELVNEEIDHNFPKPHKDMLRQGIAFDVPVEKFDDLAAYDGSVIAERTKGELSARCDKEEMNFLAINLAHDIINGKTSVEEARKTYAQTAAQFMKGERPPYTTGLRFTRPVSDEAGDPDETMLMEAMKGLVK